MMNKTYDPATLEPQWLEHLTTSTVPRPGSPTYCIMLPPPNVTGSLHMGHGFQQTLMDILARYQRMCGKDVLWQGGTDHAGIATQILVEQQLREQGKTRQALGREAFLEAVWKWKARSGDRIFSQMKRLGYSLDWKNTCFTMDPALSRATYEAFIRLYDDGLIYRGKKLVNWDPQLGTAVSDLEVETEEQDGSLWFMRYPLAGQVADQETYLVVATTRPETLFGDVAVAVHPQDLRYQRYIGQFLQLPLTSRTIPVIADEAVDPHFGTGCVKITPAHDFNDYEVGKRHGLLPMNIFTPAAALNHNVPEAYQGLDRYVARDRVVSALRQQGLLDTIQKHVLSVPRGDRSGAVIEPYLTDQWFVKTQDLAASAMQHPPVFIPELWGKNYMQWLENIEDWCISRQLWWGHRIPVWYDTAGRSYAGLDENDVRRRYSLAPSVFLQQDSDVLDTWFSASLWPFATLGWPEQTERLKTYFPTQVLITGFDIIFFWVARMVMMSHYLTGQLPFQVVYITGLIRDSQGKKMSKSKGNVLDPLDLVDGIELEALIQKRTSHLLQPQMKAKIEAATRREFPQGIKAYGADALRFTFCALSTGGRDNHFDMTRIEGYRHFCNKIWNVARYVLVHTAQHSMQTMGMGTESHLADRWMVSHLQGVIQQVVRYFSVYRFDLLSQTLYEFIWNEYCDWYVELVKVRLNDVACTTEQKGAARFTLIHVLGAILRLIHPIMPFITQEIWQYMPSDMACVDSTFPEIQETLVDPEAEAHILWLKSIVMAIRKARSEMQIPISQTVTVLWSQGTVTDQQYFAVWEREIKVLAKVDALSMQSDFNLSGLFRKIMIDQLEIIVVYTSTADHTAEIASKTASEKIRLDKEITCVQQEIMKSEAKLERPDYIHKAPPLIVEQERQRLQHWRTLLEKLILQRGE